MAVTSTPCFNITRIASVLSNPPENSATAFAMILVQGSRKINVILYCILILLTT